MPPLSFSMGVSLHSFRVLVLLALAFVMAGCGADDSRPGAGSPGTGPTTCAPGELLFDGGCQAAGLPPGVTAGLPPDMPCPPGETPLEGGRCEPAGVPPEACGQGFEPDGRAGCNPILPEGLCPPGEMAVPGDTCCHEVAPCGDGDYGMIPVEATTQFVNTAYAGDDGDGTQAKPWRRIQDAIDQARPGAIVAVAAGRYLEDVLIADKPVRLWGRCPALVEVTGAGAESAAVQVLRSRASRSEVRGISITGSRTGIGTSGAEELAIDRVWIHDTTGRGLDVEDGLGKTSITMTDSLIEATGDIGVFVAGSRATIERSVVRATQALGDDTIGSGIEAHYHPSTDERATVILRTSLLEQNHETGMIIAGSDATIEATVVRGTQPRSDGTTGYGIYAVEYPATSERATATLRSSLLEQNHEVGVFVAGSDATVEATVVRDTQPGSNGKLGRGIEVDVGSGTDDGSTLTLRASLVERSHEMGIRVRGSDATIDSAIVRGAGSAGVAVVERGGTEQDVHLAPGRARLTLRTSLLVENHDIGVFVSGSDATIEATVVRDTQPLRGGTGGSGISILDDLASHERAQVTLRSSIVERNHGAGIRVRGSDATIESTIVRATGPNNDEANGDGIQITEGPAPNNRATMALRTSIVEENHGSGVFVQSSDAAIESTIVRGTRPGGDGAISAGIAVQNSGVTIQDVPTTPERARLTMRASVLERNHGVGVLVVGSDASIEATVVRDTQPLGDGTRGRGISIQTSSTLALRTSLVEQSREAGILVLDSDATIEASAVRDTQSRGDGTFGDGIAVVSTSVPATAVITSTEVAANARAGVSNFSAAVTLVLCTIRCNAFDLNAEVELNGRPPTFAGRKDNLCGCDEPDSSCPVVRSELSPPQPIPPAP